MTGLIVVVAIAGSLIYLATLDVVTALKNITNVLAGIHRILEEKKNN